MQSAIWEDFISLNSRSDVTDQVLGPVRDYVEQDNGTVLWNRTALPVEIAVARDTSSLPLTEHREGYYGDNHFNYWASGLRDYFQIEEWTKRNRFRIGSFLDIGCATGRILRHLHFQTDIDTVYGCDINRQHVDWISRFLPPDIMVFQNTSLPNLPLPDQSVDFISAFSVFTHIECFDSTWLMELRRILRPGGIAWLTIHGDRTWREMRPDWPGYAGLDAHPEFQKHRQSAELPVDRLICRWHNDMSYTGNVFYSFEYIRRHWGRLFEVVDFMSTLPAYQDIVVLRKG